MCTKKLLFADSCYFCFTRMEKICEMENNRIFCDVKIHRLIEPLFDVANEKIHNKFLMLSYKKLIHLVEGLTLNLITLFPHSHPHSREREARMLARIKLKIPQFPL